MWPWEHAMIGYLAYSLFARAYDGEPPGAREAVAVVFAAVLPDLIDKPLSWEFGVFETGYALGHSIFFAVPLSIAVGLIARVRGSTRVGIAFGVGYLLHLPGDVVFQALGGSHSLAVVLWPVETTPTFGNPAGFLENFSRLFGQYRARLLAGDLSTYMWLQVGTAAAAALLWLADGAPVVREFLGGSLRIARSAVGR